MGAFDFFLLMCYNGFIRKESFMTASRASKNNYVPVDYEDLYRYYIIGAGHGNSLTHQILRTMMPFATEDERETLAHDVWLRMFEKKILDVFDPTKSNFGGVIFFVTRTIVGNHLNRKGRNPLTGLKGGSLTTGEAAPDATFEPGVYHLDKLFVTETPDPTAVMDLADLFDLLVEECRLLAEKPKSNKRERSLLPLINLLVKECDPEECGEQLDVTPSTIHNWLGVLREMVEEIKTTILAPKPQVLPPGKILPIEEG
jgi:hypothetical protein